MEGALGIIEIKGLATAVAVADVMAKTAAVNVIGLERAQGGGWMTIKVSGNVAAVNASVSAGRQIGMAHGSLISSKVIARPSEQISRLFCRTEEAPLPPAEPVPEAERAPEEQPAALEMQDPEAAVQPPEAPAPAALEEQSSAASPEPVPSETPADAEPTVTEPHDTAPTPITASAATPAPAGSTASVPAKKAPSKAGRTRAGGARKQKQAAEQSP